MNLIQHGFLGKSPVYFESYENLQFIGDFPWPWLIFNWFSIKTAKGNRSWGKMPRPTGTWTVKACFKRVAAWGFCSYPVIPMKSPWQVLLRHRLIDHHKRVIYPSYVYLLILQAPTPSHFCRLNSSTIRSIPAHIQKNIIRSAIHSTRSSMIPNSLVNVYSSLVKMAQSK